MYARHIPTYKHTHPDRQRDTYIHTYIHTKVQTCREIHILVESDIGRETDNPTYMYIKKPIRQGDKHTYTQTEIYIQRFMQTYTHTLQTDTERP